MHRYLIVISLFATSALAEVRYRCPDDHYSDPQYMAGGSGGVVRRFFQSSGRELYGVRGKDDHNWRISGVKRESLRQSLYFAGYNSGQRLIFRRRDAIGTGRRIYGFKTIRH